MDLLNQNQNADTNKMAARIMVALDYPDVSMAQQLLHQLSGTGCYIKVGMQLFYAAGPDFIRELKQRGYYVFLDLKLHDIPNTVRGAAASIAKLGVDMFNVHAAGGVKMMEQAIQGIQDANPLRLPSIIAVTQLTSTDSVVMNEQIGIAGSVQDCVIRYASLAKQAGLAGVVASPQEVKRIKSQVGESFITVTPGIRPAGTDMNDQSRVMTPQEAFEQGTDFIVVGRPITAAVNPLQAFNEILNSITK